MPADDADRFALTDQLFDRGRNDVLEPGRILNDRDRSRLIEVVEHHAPVAFDDGDLVFFDFLVSHRLHAIGARCLLLLLVVGIDEANDNLTVRRGGVLGKQIAHVPLGGVERRGEILGEVCRDLETVVEARREPFGTLG